METTSGGAIAGDATSEDAISQAVESVRQKLPNVLLKLDEPVKLYSTFRIGGSVRVMFFPDSVISLTEILSILGESGVIPFIMGNGSNVLADDSRLDIAIINTSGLNGIKLLNEGNSETQGHWDITAQAGAKLSELAVFAYENSLTGLEFAHGIPGTLGGAVVMNAGAYDGEMKDVIYSTDVYNIKTGRYTVTAAEHEFSYRHSRFSKKDDIVLSSIVRLEKGDKASIKKKMDELKIRRTESQPLDLPSCGSTFKRPADGYATALIEQSGLKGYKVGGAQVSEKHAGFIVNNGDATFSDVMTVIKHVREVVFKKFGTMLELEVKVLEG